MVMLARHSPTVEKVGRERKLEPAPTWRDYAITGPANRAAVAKGLASASWYKSPLPREQLKQLSRRSDGPAVRDTAIWFAGLAISGILGYVAWGTWWAIPAFFVYGTLYGSASSSRWHECGHGTAFKTPWLNNAVYNIASFMVLREPTPWRWSHARHHTDTLIVGRDPEIAVPRPPRFMNFAFDLLSLKAGPSELRKMFIHAAGSMTEAERDYIPESEFPRVYLAARIFLAILGATLLVALATGSILPLMYIGLPSFYGCWFTRLTGPTQHAGLAEDVLDHRLNSRTVVLNPLFSFLYWNMNYHIEHHMFPNVPYHALPALHEAVKPTLPPAYRGLWQVYREMIPALIRQQRDPAYHIERQLPPGAAPFLGPAGRVSANQNHGA